MQVDVKDLLEGRLAVSQEERDAFTPETGQPQRPSDTVPHLPDPYSQVIRQVHQSLHMRLRNNKHVPRSNRAQIHERDNPVILMDNTRSHTAPHDPAEDTTIVRQPSLHTLTDTTYLNTSNTTVPTQ